MDRILQDIDECIYYLMKNFLISYDQAFEYVMKNDVETILGIV